MDKLKGDKLNAVVSQRIEVSPSTIILRVSPDGWDLPDFIPGQFTVLGLPPGAPRLGLCDPEDPPPDPERLIKRAYSIASSSREKEYLEFYINLVRSGSLTPRLFALEIGDRLWMSSKFCGVFTMEEIPGDVNVAMVATGTGLAPYMSMLRTRLEHAGRRRYAVLHGARHSWDLGYGSELAAMERLSAGFTYLPVVSRPDEEHAGWGGFTGHVEYLWAGGALAEAWGFEPAPEDTHVLLCGNPAMIEDMIRFLGGKGFREHTKKTPGQIHLERYW